MRYLGVLLLLANCGLADTVMFRDGHQVSGSFLGGDSRTIRVAVGDHVDTIPVADVDRIMFGDSGQALAPPVYRGRSRHHRLLRQHATIIFLHGVMIFPSGAMILTGR